MALDNLSALRPAMSDAICRLSTGYTFTQRVGTAEREQRTVTVEAPVILNGIGDMAPRADLADRTIVIDLEPISEGKRRLRNELLEKFAKALPRLLGVLFDALAEGLRNGQRTVHGHSRMADFEHFISACETAYWQPGTFIEAYRANQADSAHDAVDGNPVAGGVRDFVISGGSFEGTHEDLLEKLRAFRSSPAETCAWPPTPKALSNILRRTAPDFRKTGIVITHSRRAGGNRDRIINATITASSEAVPSTKTAPAAQKHSPRPTTVPVSRGRYSVSSGQKRNYRDGWDDRAANAVVLIPAGDHQDSGFCRVA